MEKKMETTIMGYVGLRVWRIQLQDVLTGLWLAGNEGMEKNETTIMGSIGTTIRLGYSKLTKRPVIQPQKQS